MAKSSRNKTIDFPIEEGQEYIDRCITPEQPAALEQITDKTICGDTMQICSLLPSHCADLIIADPPYNLTKDFHGNSFRKTGDNDYRTYTEQWIKAVKHLLKPDGTIYVCCDWKCSNIIAEVLSEHFTIQNRITWQREKGRGAKANWKNGMEDIWFATNSANYKFNVEDVKVRRKVIAPYRDNGTPKDWQETEKGNFRDTHPSNFWDDITIPFWSMPENTAHPTQKPEKLIAKLILASSDEGDFVFDPFLGSGTTSVVAKKLKRHFCGIEQNPLYCAWAEKRLENTSTDKNIQGYNDNVFWERNTLGEQNTKK